MRSAIKIAKLRLKKRSHTNKASGTQRLSSHYPIVGESLRSGTLCGFYCHSYCRPEIYFDVSEIRLLTLRSHFQMSISTALDFFLLQGLIAVVAQEKIGGKGNLSILSRVL